MDFPEVRTFLLASYRDLPNVLFVGALILGSVLGYLPLIWIALGLLFNGGITWLGQRLLAFLIDVVPFLKKYANQLYLQGTSDKCFVGFRVHPSLNDGLPESIRKRISNVDAETVVAPSYWMSATAFFAVFSIYNSINVAIKNTKTNDPTRTDFQQLVQNRKAFSVTTAIIGFVFLCLLAVRAFTGCETKVGGTMGVLFGLGTAIGFWHILDACGTGKIPDVLQVIGSMAPPPRVGETPVMCTAESLDAPVPRATTAS